jgi:hypothetical protein
METVYISAQKAIGKPMIVAMSYKSIQKAEQLLCDMNKTEMISLSNELFCSIVNTDYEYVARAPETHMWRKYSGEVLQLVLLRRRLYNIPLDILDAEQFANWKKDMASKGFACLS